MRMLCIEGNLAKSVRSWRLTTILFAVIYFLPLGLFYAAHLFAIVTRQSFIINLPPATLLLLIPIFAIPLVHFFISTSRMKREAESAQPIFVEGESPLLPPDSL
jgi:energy-coupling factor transporter transmembrane protein EcfT